MKKKLIIKGTIAMMVMTLSLLLVSCEEDDLDMGNNPVSNENVTAFGGNLECTDHDESTGRIDYDAKTNTFSHPWPDGLNVTVTGGTYVEFSLEESFQIEGVYYQVGSVIVKGGESANLYTYPAGTTGASGLVSPPNRGRKIPELSNLTFCFIEVDSPESEECEWEKETAYGGNTGINLSGDDPRYVFNTNNSSLQAIYIGQEYIGGAYVNYSGGKLTIVLGENMRLQGDDKAVKIMGSETLPDSDETLKLLYEGTDLNLEVKKHNFFVIQLNVEICWMNNSTDVAI